MFKDDQQWKPRIRDDPIFVAGKNTGFNGKDQPTAICNPQRNHEKQRWKRVKG